MLHKNLNQTSSPWTKESNETGYSEIYLALGQLLGIDQEGKLITHDITNDVTKNFKKLLVKGHNPNGSLDHKENVEPLISAIILRAIIEYRHLNSSYYMKNFYLVMELLLIYGANPFARYKNNSSTPIENAKYYDQYDVINLIDSFCNKPEKPIKTFITKTDVSYDPENKEIKTTLIFNAQNPTVHTAIKKLNNPLKQAEKIHFLALFKKLYEAVQQRPTIDEIFEEDLKPAQNKYIETIFIMQNGKKIMIGFHLFEIIRQQDYMISCGTHILIDTPYRNLGIASFIAFRPGFSLQLSHPNQKIGIFVCSIHSNSYLMVKDFLHFPKYKARHIELLVKNILKKIYGEGLKFYSDETMSCYIEEKNPIQVKETKVDSQSFSFNPHKRFFDTLILDNKKGKGVPIFFNVADKNAKTLSDSINKSGLNFNHEIDKFSRCFDLNTHSRSLFPNNQLLFWNNVFHRREQRSDVLINKSFIRSNL